MSPSFFFQMLVLNDLRVLLNVITKFYKIVGNQNYKRLNSLTSKRTLNTRVYVYFNCTQYNTIYTKTCIFIFLNIHGIETSNFVLTFRSCLVFFYWLLIVFFFFEPARFSVVTWFFTVGNGVVKTKWHILDSNAYRNILRCTKKKE